MDCPTRHSSVRLETRRPRAATLAGNMKSQKQIIGTVLQWVFILGVYVYALVSSYNTGRQRMFYLLLAQIPFFFICWGLSILLSGRTVRDISKHLTQEERAESTRLARSYGGKMGIFVAAPFALLCAWLHISERGGVKTA